MSSEQSEKSNKIEKRKVEFDIRESSADRKKGEKISVIIVLFILGSLLINFFLFSYYSNPYQFFFSSPRIDSNREIPYDIDSRITLEINIRSISLYDKEAYSDLYGYVGKGAKINGTFYGENQHLGSVDLWYVVVFPLPNRSVVEFSRYSNITVYAAFETNLLDYPYEEYTYYFMLEGLNDINVTDIEDFYFSATFSSKSFSFISKFENLSMIDNMFRYEVLFYLTRSPVSIIIDHLILPIAILSSIFYVGCIITKPYLDRKKESELNTELDLDRKFRIDTSKWIFAFSIANIYFNPSRIGILTIGYFHSVMTLVISALFFAFSKFQGKKHGFITYCIAFFALFWLLIIFIPIVFSIFNIEIF